MISNRFLFLTCFLIVIYSQLPLVDSWFTSARKGKSRANSGGVSSPVATPSQRTYTKITCEDYREKTTYPVSASGTKVLSMDVSKMERIYNPSAPPTIHKCVHHNYTQWEDVIRNTEPDVIDESFVEIFIDRDVAAYTCFDETMALPFLSVVKYYWSKEDDIRSITGVPEKGVLQSRYIMKEDKNKRVFWLNLKKRWQENNNEATTTFLFGTPRDEGIETKIVKVLEEEQPAMKTEFKQLECPKIIEELKEKGISTKKPSQVPQPKFEEDGDIKLNADTITRSPSSSAVSEWGNDDKPMEVGTNDYGYSLLVGTEIKWEIGSSTHHSTCVQVKITPAMRLTELCKAFHLGLAETGKRVPGGILKNSGTQKDEFPIYFDQKLDGIDGYTCFNYNLGVPFHKIVKRYRGITAMHSITFTHEKFEIQKTEPNYIWKKNKDNLVCRVLMEDEEKNKGYQTIDFVETTYRTYGKMVEAVMYRGEETIAAHQLDYDDSCKDLLE